MNRKKVSRLQKVSKSIPALAVAYAVAYAVAHAVCKRRDARV